MLYLTGTSNDQTRDAGGLFWQEIGLLVQPDTRKYRTHIPDYAAWALDNGCYAQGPRFDLARYLRLATELQPHADRCLFATAPDVVGDAAATWERSAPVLEELRRLGYKAALVAQDGATPAALEWDAFDVLFIGGTTAWKLSPAALRLVHEAKRRGKWVHMGRVNSLRRLKLAVAWGCDSVDGNYIAFAPRRNLERVIQWLDAINPILPLPPVTLNQKEAA